MTTKLNENTNKKGEEFQAYPANEQDLIFTQFTFRVNALTTISDDTS